MLFNSYAFLLGFLPVTLAVFHLAQRRYGMRGALAWLVTASLFFYGFWKPAYLALIAASVALNFVIGRCLLGLPAERRRLRKALLCAGLGANLGALGYYKYAGFFVGSLGALFGEALAIQHIVLPLAISFFTFQQVGYLVDTYRGRTSPHGFAEYAFFILFFPQLIAGPIVRHGELMPQLRAGSLTLRAENFAVGATLVVFGLFKKVVIADHLAHAVSPTHEALAQGIAPGAPLAWLCVLAYSLQLYFDFSGYSDMAAGLARVFGLRFPHNFDSPYKATSIIDFWRRWHVTLSRFLRDYLYVPLGGSRGGWPLRARNLMITMVLGGLWHGAGFGFLLWGVVHGLLLLANHALVAASERLGLAAIARNRAFTQAASLSTFLLVTLSWIPFRSVDLRSAHMLFSALWTTVDAERMHEFTREHGGYALLTACAFVVARVAPNSQEVLAEWQPILGQELQPGRFGWRPSDRWAVTVAALGTASVLCLTQVSEFLYFQF